MWDLHFHKYQGTGNDFIIIDDRKGTIESRLDQSLIHRLCDRRFGIGADGLMLLQEHPDVDFRMVYFNSDGRQSSMCGNGGRCLVHFAHQSGSIGSRAVFEAIDGLHEAIVEEEQVRLKMGKPTGFRQESSSRDWVDTGSPHVVEWMDSTLDQLNVATEGARLRYADLYAPGGTNVNFVRESAAGILDVRTYERGVEAETFSCGTGVTACAYAYLTRKNQSVGTTTIQTPGGTLTVEVNNRGEENEEIWLCGPATFVYSGTIVV